MNCTKHKYSKNKLALAVTAALAFSSATLAHADSNEKTVEFNIQQGTLKAALMDLGESVGVNVVFYGDISNDVDFSGLQGEYSLSQALEMMLKGTGLTFEFADNDAVLIKDNKAMEEEEADPLEDVDEEMVVTGTRLINNNNVSPASPVTVIGRDTIEKRGFTSVEEVIRSLPQNFSTQNSGSPSNFSSSTLHRGSSSANLRGLGNGYTLVLVNSKRISSAPTSSAGFTDLSTIPFAAIERIEVLSDGGAAIYGADAVAGVINVILKKDYAGAQTNLRIENSSSNADSYTLEQTFGFNWESGNFTSSLSYQTAKSVDAAAAGITTLDLRNRGGRDWRTPFSQPGNLRSLFSGGPAGTAYGALPEGDGTDVSFDDIVWISQEDVDNQAGDYDLLNLDASELANTLTPDTKNLSAWVSLSQDLTEDITAELGLSYSKRESETQMPTFSFFGFVPESNAYNNFDRRVYVNYAFFNEAASGLITSADILSEAERLGANASFEFNLPVRDWSVNLDLNYNRDIGQNGQVSFAQRGTPSRDALDAALASSDPETAINLFGDGTVQPVDLNAMVAFIDQQPRESSVRSIELGGTGSVMTLPGGDVSLAIGGEYRLREEDYTRTTVGSFDSLLESEMSAAYVELAIPVVGADNAMPGVQGLSLSLAGRYESFDDNLEEIKTNYSTAVTKFGISWYPVEDLKIRATLGRGFKTPSLIDLFDTRREFSLARRDPANPASNGGASAFIPYTFINGGNPNLEEEDSTTTTIGFDYTPGFLTGLTASISFVKTEVDGLIENPVVVAGADYVLANWTFFPDTVIRDSDGVLQELYFTAANINSKVSEAVDFDVRYNFEDDSGDWTVGVWGTYTSNLAYEFAPGLPPQMQDNTEHGPERWKGFGFVDWSRGNWSANLFVNRSSGYLRDPESWNLSTQNSVKSYTTVDTQVGYQFPEGQLDVAVGVKNLFDEDFPLFDFNHGADPRRVDLRRRVVYLTVRKAFGF